MSELSFKPVGLDRPRLLALMKEHGLDGIFLSTPENVFYTTGYPCLPGSGNPIIHALRNQDPYFVFLGSDGGISLLCWGPAAMGIEYGTEDVRMSFTTQMAANDLAALIEEKLKPGCMVGVESTFPYYATRLLEEKAKPANILVVDDLLTRLRLIKSAAEVERIRKSTEIIDKTVMELAQSLRLGMTRLELIQEAKYQMIKNGAEGVDHVTMAFGTANPEIALDEPLEANQIVTLDLGAVYQGYVSDNRRLVYTGSVPDALKELHKKLCWIVAEMGKALRPGKTFSEVHAYAAELYAKMGIDPMYLHVGHSVGLQVEECWIMSDNPTVIEPGMVLNIELYSPSEDGVMIGDEETFLVTSGEPEKLSTLPVDIIERKF
ncbi:MAG TPA: Xaa-Pro peptidase family protein [Anaerolineales bacterium]